MEDTTTTAVPYTPFNLLREKDVATHQADLTQVIDKENFN